MLKVNKLPTVLIVEDDRVDAMILRELLERDGRFGPIRTVGDGEAAILLWDKVDSAPIESAYRPDVVFLDINMPRLDGFEFLDAFERLPSDRRGPTRVVMLLGSLDPSRDFARARRHASVIASLEKPFTSAAVGHIAETLRAMPLESRSSSRRSE